MLMLPVWHSYHSLQDSCNPCRHGQDKEESISPKGLHPVRAGNQKTPEISIKTTPRIQGETKECAIFSGVRFHMLSAFRTASLTGREGPRKPSCLVLS